ncbi:asparagine synthase-related protein [Vibrio owensii]|uniref:asparagine synthase-related protein n=1 Tax=Vibrio owensii TaxID=696485 RepID=UPI002FEF1E22
MSKPGLGTRTFYSEGGNGIHYEKHISQFDLQGRMVDPVSIMEFLMKNYMFSNRTMVQGIERTPWMAEHKVQDGQIWNHLDLPPHLKEKKSSSEIAKELKKLLEVEALEFLDGKKSIGILLSGGMDSRIVAAVVRELQITGKYVGSVTALTWGEKDSRDVVYAQRIAQQFGWEFCYKPLTAEVLYKNVFLTAERGAEYSPVHLHAMEDISKTVGVDGILAGSYGDSIGRGEYSGRKTSDLPHILDRHMNHFAFLRTSVEKTAIHDIRADLERERARFPGRSEMSYREIEMQQHYMRRQLNACMEVIDDKIPLYQMFTAPDVFGFMWSLDSSCRNDDNYERLLELLPGNLLDIPWARTGHRYNKPNSTVEDSLPSRNNSYGKWLRNDLRSTILNEINSGVLQNLGIFNEKSLNMWARHWPKTTHAKADRLDEKMAWLASFSIFVRNNNLKSQGSENSIFDDFHQLKAFAHTKLYHTALKVRK